MFQMIASSVVRVFSKGGKSGYMLTEGYSILTTVSYRSSQWDTFRELR